MIRPVTYPTVNHWSLEELLAGTYHGRYRMDRVSPFGIELELPVDILLLKERRQRL